MSLLKKTSVVAIGIVAALFLGYFFFNIFSSQEETISSPQKISVSEEKQHESSTRYVPTRSTAEKESLSSLSTESMINNKTKVYYNDKSAKHSIAEKEKQLQPDHCMDTACVERVIAFLNDPSNNEAAKVAMAKTWLKPQSKEEMLALLQLLKESYGAKHYDLQDRLRQILAGADSIESAELLIAVLNGDESSFVFNELPKDMQYAIKKIIRLNPDERIGKLLADEFGYQRSEETLAAVQDVKRPDMVYHLAQDADSRGETGKVRELVQSLQTVADPRTLEVIMRLGNEQIINQEEAVKAAYHWVDSHQENFTQDSYVGYLSDPAAGTMERIVASAALAAASDPAQAMAALQKAYDAEADQNLHLAYEEAIERVRRRMKPVRAAE